MRVMTPICLTTCATLLSGCVGATQWVVADVPAELRQPVPVPDRPVRTLRDATLLIVDYDQALVEANSRITAIDEILTQAEAREGPR